MVLRNIIAAYISQSIELFIIITCLSNPILDRFISPSYLSIVIRVIIKIPCQNIMHWWLRVPWFVSLTVHSIFYILRIEHLEFASVIDDFARRILF